ncbi:MAG: FG-GAP repeat protein [Myxococcales bacterium]|nr:FG-GAP repeat protein [Myxococcales bacterium]
MRNLNNRVLPALAPFALALCLSGCNFLFFTDAGDEASIRVIEPEAFGSGFGGALSAVDDGSGQSRLYVTSRGTARIDIYAGWNQGQTSLDIDIPRLDTFCQKDCDRASAAKELNSKVGGVWDGTSFCGYGPAFKHNGNAIAVVQNCGSEDVFTTFPGDVDNPPFEMGSAVVPYGGTTSDGVVLSDPENQRLLSVTKDEGDEFDLGEFKPKDKLGLAMGSFPLDADNTRLAVSDGDEVVLLDIDENRAITVKGCLDAPSSSSIVLGDLIGDDGEPEILVGTTQGVLVFEGESAANEGCSGALLKPTQSFDCSDLQYDNNTAGACSSVEERSAAVALADVNGDGRPELLVGAPATEVEGSANAGAVFVIPTADDNDEPIVLGDAVSLPHPNPKAGAHLGAAVAALRTFPSAGARDEIVAGVPGKNRAYVYLCSGLAQDKPGGKLDVLCQP